jgi:hypothetical protein
LARLPWRCLRRWSWTFLHQAHRERGSFNTSILVILSFSRMISFSSRILLILC